jgi:voltage-gated sodium channel
MYPLSWVYYLTFIFLAAFVFLNMMIGAILEVMSEEQNTRQTEQAHNERDELMQKLQAVQNQISELSQQIADKR